MTYQGETTVELAALEWFAELGYGVAFGPDLAPDGARSERPDYRNVVLSDRLRDSLARLNPHLPSSAIDDGLRRVVRTDSPALVDDNRQFHKLLTDGIEIEYQAADGSQRPDIVQLFDFADPARNDWLVVNQFTVIEDGHNRRPDVVVFVNGLPLAVIELKDAANTQATLKKAFNQLQTYKADIPGLFRFNAVLVASDGTGARLGSLTAGYDRFQPWRTIDGAALAPKGRAELQVLIQGVFEKSRFLDLIRNFIVFQDDDGKWVKKVAAYHQFHAVNKAVEATIDAASPDGDRRAGVVWHTQGSGKSLTMAFYAGKIIRDPRMQNPTLVVLTDRNDLDDQLFDTFASCRDLLRQTPVQADGREDLKTRLNVASGGVVFTTIQKFLPDPGQGYPKLSDRRNIVFVADEAHRSQYGLRARVVTNKETGAASVAYGFAKHVRDALPQASYIGFTGTPIEDADKSTRAVFGEYIDVYDIHRAIDDGATVPIYYAARLVKIDLDQDLKDVLDDEFEDATETEEQDHKEKLKSKWARLEALVGADNRIKAMAADIIAHFEDRQQAIAGKAMVVCMSRRICIDLYDAIIALRPDWHDPADDKGVLKVVMTGSASDDPSWQPHIRTKPLRRKLSDRFKKPDDPFRLVIVRDMWLTGFDVPCLHTMYVDKPMRGHGLMQAIARVNRVFKDKPGGLVVDYLGIGEQLKKALAQYTRITDEDAEIFDQDEAVRAMQERYEVLCDLFHGFDWRRFFVAAPGEQLNIMASATEHVLALEHADKVFQATPDALENLEAQGRRRFIQAVDGLSRAFALAMPHDAALVIRDDVAFFQAVRATLVKYTIRDDGDDGTGAETALRQIVSQAITTDRIIDIFGEAGLDKPDISILSDEFLAEVRELPQKNLALEALRKLLNDEIRVCERQNLVQARSFKEMLEQAVRKYHNRAVDTAQIIQELIELAKQLKAAARRGEELGLNVEELAFYDALEVNDSAVQAMGDENLRIIARELVQTVRNTVGIDWTEKEAVRAKLRVLVKRVLKKYGYPPDKQAAAVQTILEQAKIFGDSLVAF